MDLDEYFKSLENKTICFIGFGVSHRDLSKLYALYGAKIKVCDKSETLEEIDEYKKLGIEFFLGEDYLKHIDADIIFRSPGVLFYTEELSRCRENGRLVTSEIETFFELCPAPIYGISGSDGKTTSSTIIAEVLKKSGKTVHLGGNIGKPLLPMIEKISKNDVCVLELSSFQLISMRMSPKVAIITNIYRNHLDMHKDMDEYIGAKKNIFLHQHGGTRFITNADNEECKHFPALARDEVRLFSKKSRPQRGAYLRSDGMLVMAIDGAEHEIVNKSEIKIPGEHNVENFLAVIAALWGDASKEDIAEVARTFSGVEHRMEFVRELGGARWYNDVIATTPSRTRSALNSFDRKIKLIAGGSDKGLDYTEISALILEKVSDLYLSGPTAKKILAALGGEAGFASSGIKIHEMAGLEAAVMAAHEGTESGDIIVLSPASASFDAYKGYPFKGQHFKALVMDLI